MKTDDTAAVAAIVATATSVDQLLDAVASLPHSRRCSIFIALGQYCSGLDASETKLLELLCDMAKPTEINYHRFVAAMAIRGSLVGYQQRQKAVPLLVRRTAHQLLLDPSTNIAALLMSPVLDSFYLQHAAPSTSAGTTNRAASIPPAEQHREAELMALLCCMSTSSLDRMCRHLTSTKYISIAPLLYRDYIVGSPTSRKSQLLVQCLPASALAALPSQDVAYFSTSTLRRLAQRQPDWLVVHLQQKVSTMRVDGVASPSAVEQQVLSALIFLADSGSGKKGLQLLCSTLHLLELDSTAFSKAIERFYFSAYPLEMAKYLLQEDPQQRSNGAAVDGHPIRRIGHQLKRVRLTRRTWKRFSSVPEIVVQLFECGVLPPMNQLFPLLPATARQLLYDTKRVKLVDERGIFSAHLVPHLPSAADRLKEARLQLAHPLLSAEPYQRLPYLAVLPFPDAVTAGEEYVKSSDADLREQMLRALMDGLRWYPEYLPALLDFCLLRSKERDSWRRMLYVSLGQLPLKVWQTSGADAATIFAKLEKLSDVAFESKDASEDSLSSLQECLKRLLCVYPLQATPLLLRSLEQCRFLSCCPASILGYLRGKSPEVMLHVAKSLLTAAQRYIKGGSTNEGVYECLLRFFDHPTWRWIAGQEIEGDLGLTLLQQGMNSKYRYHALYCFTTYSKAFPQHVLRHLADLVEEQEDWLYVEEVQRCISCCLQGALLDKIVVPVSYYPNMRFDFWPDCPYDSSYRVLSLNLRYANRWTAKHQETYSRTILDELESPPHRTIDESRLLCTPTPLFDFRQSLFLLAQLPSVPVHFSSTTGNTSLAALAQNGEELVHSIYAQQWAMDAVSRAADRRSAVPILLSLLAGESTQSTVGLEALRALQRVLRNASSAEVIQALETGLMAPRITLQKESLYIVSALEDEAAYQRLCRFAAEGGLPLPTDSANSNEKQSSRAAEGSGSGSAPTPVMHRDVRAALVRCLFKFLDREQVWQYFEQLAIQDEALAAAEGTPESAEAAAPQSTAACETMTAISWSNLPFSWQLERYTALLERLLRHPALSVQRAVLNRLAEIPKLTSDSVFYAVAAFIEKEPVKRSLLHSTMRCLLQTQSPSNMKWLSETVVSVKSDVTLEAVIQALESLASGVRQQQQKDCVYALGSAIVDGLIRSRRQPALAARLIIKFPPTEWAPRVEELQESGLMHTGVAAYFASAGAEQRYCVSGGITALEAVEEQLWRHHRIGIVRRMGLEVLAQAAQSDGWTASRRSAMEQYCQDEDLWVCNDARLKKVPNEI